MRLFAGFESIESDCAIIVRHRRTFAVGAMIGFWASMAVYARFIQLPDFLTPLKGPLFWSSVAGNMIWRTMLSPAIDKPIKAQHNTADQIDNKSEQT